MLTVTVILIVTVFIVLSGKSYAYLEKSVEGSCVSLQVGNLDQDLLGKITLEKNKTLKMEFIIKNTDSVSSKYQMYYKTDTEISNVVVGYSIYSVSLPSGEIGKNEEKIVKIILQNNISKDVVVTIGVKGGLSNNSIEDIILEDDEYRITEVIDDSVYTESILNGTDPVLTDNLIPVLIADDGEVTKADIAEEWYKYEKQRWANAVVLVDNEIGYNSGDVIPESNIESYFVWIPRYKYKIFDMGNYSSLTSLTNAVQAIEVVFETKDIPVSTASAVGDWHSHPAFQAFDSNGFWVGKFESGYSGATSTATAQVNASDASKLIIKPNVYSWRNITVGNAFKVSYDYMRSEESHLMKNTEWGAVAYLQHSNYGSRQSVRVNNNSAYITGYAAAVEPTLNYYGGSSISGNLVESTVLNKDGTNTKKYNTTTGYTASTTNNISGVYDMSGGAHEYVMGYNESASSIGGSSGLTAIYGDFFISETYDKYYDKYKSISDVLFSNRILGDATGEIGPFSKVTISYDSTIRQTSSWYNDYAFFLNANNPWVHRGGRWTDGIGAGVFVFNRTSGDTNEIISFRVVLAP